MKRYIIFTLAALSIFTCSAWNKFGQQCIATFAEQNLTNSAKEQVTQILGGSMASESWWLQDILKEEENKHTGSWHFISLAKNITSTTTDAKDGVVQIERCVDILKNRAEHSDSTVVASLKTLIHLVADMHNIGHIRIEGVQYSKKNFALQISNGKPGKKETISNVSWRKFWDSSLVNRHSVFSPALMAEDLGLCYGSEKENFCKGDVRHWAADMGRLAAPLYKWAKPDYYMTREQHNRLVPLSDKCLARAGYRLATLLNDIFK